jgi:Actinobacteria/chloroflexi VLRF1 release factor
MSADTAPTRLVRVSAERLAGWIDRFAQRHGGVRFESQQEAVLLTAPDGATALVRDRFGPVEEHPDLRTALLDHVRRDRLVGVILVRRGGYAVGVFEGRGLRISKVGRTYVQGRTKAGGWSQQRYARRRAQQADQAYAAAAETAAEILLPVVDELDAVVGGGDRGAVDVVLADPRLAPLRRMLTGPVLPTSDPRLDVLRRFGDQLREVEITLNELA